MWHTYLAEDSQKGFSELFLSPNLNGGLGLKPEVSLSGEECSTQPYACVDQKGQSCTWLNVLHADAVLRHRPSDDQLARMDDYYYSQSASIFTLSIFTLLVSLLLSTFTLEYFYSGFHKVLLSTLPTYPCPGYVWSSFLCIMLTQQPPWKLSEDHK